MKNQSILLDVSLGNNCDALSRLMPCVPSKVNVLFFSLMRLLQSYPSQIPFVIQHVRQTQGRG